MTNKLTSYKVDSAKLAERKKGTKDEYEIAIFSQDAASELEVLEQLVDYKKKVLEEAKNANNILGPVELAKWKINYYKEDDMSFSREQRLIHNVQYFRRHLDDLSKA